MLRWPGGPFASITGPMSQIPDNPPARPQRRSGSWLATVMVLGLMLGAVFVHQHWDALTARYDDLVLDGQRLWRKAFIKSGMILPGTPNLSSLDDRLSETGLKLGDPIFMRIFKREFLLEIWMQRDGRFQHFATYPICRFSGTLGPKLKQGDHQSPEGVYTVGSGQLNPASRWHRSFNLGFPNTFDRAHARTGTYLMVHGGCSSVGCYAMTDGVIDEVWRIVTSALQNGQQRFQVQIFPFRMTQEALEARSEQQWTPYWQDLKIAHDLFEQTRTPPRVSVCQKRYTFQPGKPGSDGSASISSACVSSPESVATN